MLYVIRKNTKSSLEGFNWDTIIIEEIQEVSAQFHSTASVPVVHEHGSQVPPVCVTLTNQMMFAQPRTESDHFHHISLISNTPLVIGRLTNIIILATLPIISSCNY